MKGIHHLLHQLASQGASDLHISEGTRPRLRIHGELSDMEHPIINQRTMTEYLQALVTPRRFKKFMANGDLDFA